MTRKLKGESEKETFSNILEWQARNIQFWNVRWVVPLTYYIGLIIILVLLLPEIIYRIIFATVLIALYLGNEAILRPDLLILEYINPYISTMKWIIFDFFPISIFILMLYLLILKFALYKNMDWKTFCYTFVPYPNQPVNKILEYKLAICRDYARLTASLLFYIYRDPELYFIRTFWHETVGIKFKDEIYVLDQHLPILTLDNDRYANADIFRVIKNSNGEMTSQESVEKPKRKSEQQGRKTLPEINTEELTVEVAKVLKLNQKSAKDKPVKITLKKYVIYNHDALIKFHHDEIIKNSLIRAIKNRIEDDFCGNIDKISKVIISHDIENKEDLTLEVYEDD